MTNIKDEITRFIGEIDEITISDSHKFKSLLIRLKFFLESQDKRGNEIYEKIIALRDYYSSLRSPFILNDHIHELKAYINSISSLFTDDDNENKLIDTSKINPKKVFVVHGRNIKIKEEFDKFLESIDLNPVTWEEARASTGKATPYIGEILEQAFSLAKAVVILLTPDDDVILKKEFRKNNDPEFETRLYGQARPNVLFEAGMAEALHKNRTLMIEFGELKPFTDVMGKHFVRMDGSIKNREEIINRLITSGCSIIRKEGWDSVGDFSLSEKKKDDGYPSVHWG